MKNFDFLSPSITLFYFDRRTHTSKFGGILMILMVITYLAYIIYELKCSFSHLIVNSMYYKKYKYEAGYFAFNASSLFHFFQFKNVRTEIYDEYDPKNIRIFTLRTLNFTNESDLEKNDHWVFDLCEEGIDNQNIDKSLFNYINNFNNSACIKYFYNSTKGEYISKENPKFIWPFIEHGVSQRNNVNLNTIIVKCNNNSLSNKVLGFCNSEEKIKQYLNDHEEVDLIFKDNLVDPINFKNPIQSYLYSLASGIGKGLTYAENYVHFSPLNVVTNEGFIFNKKKYIKSYSFDQNRKGQALNENSFSLIVKYYYILQNNISVYERKYNNILNVFSEIGGAVQIIYYCFYGINYLYNKYIIMYDMNKVFYKIRKKQNSININNDDLQKIIKHKNRLSKVNYKKIIQPSKQMNSIKHFSYRNKNTNINLDILRKKESERSHNIPNNSLSLYGNQKKNFYLNQGDSNANIISNINKSISDNKLKIYNILNERVIINDKEIKINNRDLNFGVNNNFNYTDKSTTIFQKDFSLFFCIKNFFDRSMRNNLQVLINFRKKLLSEEHLFKNHITTVLFEKQNQIESKQDISLAEFYNEL